MSFTPMKLKALVLTAGLLAFGVTNAAWAYDKCKTNLDGQVRNSGNHCTSKSYKFNTWSKCTCPGDKANQTKKCVHNAIKPGETLKTKMYSCEVP